MPETSSLAEPHACFAEVVQRALRIEAAPHDGPHGWSRSPEDLARVRTEVEHVLSDAVGLAWDLGEAAPAGTVAKDMARFAAAELRTLLGALVARTPAGGDAVADEELLTSVLETRDRLVEVGLAIEQELADLRGVASRLHATRHVVRRRARRRESARATLASEVDAAASDERASFAARARRIASLLSRALYAAAGEALGKDERRVVRGICERVIAMVWTTRSAERESVAREIVADASAFGSLLTHAATPSVAA